MLRVLFSRRWLGALAVALAFAVAAFFLGRWQWHRYEAKSARAERIHAHYDAKPVPVRTVLGATPLPLAADWTRVTMHGRYAAGHTLLVRNRPHEGTFGYEVLVPLELDDGSEVLVDRGWVVNGATAQTAPDVPATPTQDVTVTGWLRRGEPSLGKTQVAGQLASINLTEASAQTGSPLLGGYAVLEVERLADGTAPRRPTPLEAPDTDLGPHQAYAFQWWGSMLAGFVLVGFGIRREHQEGQPTQAAGEPPKARKVRIWDEEDG